MMTMRKAVLKQLWVYISWEVYIMLHNQYTVQQMLSWINLCMESYQAVSFLQSKGYTKEFHRRIYIEYICFCVWFVLQWSGEWPGVVDEQ